MSIIITNNFVLTWHILFQAFVKYRLHSKHLNKILFEIVNFGVLQHFSETIKNTSSSTKKKNKCTSIEAIIITLHKITSTNNIKQEINLHDMSDEESSIVGGE